MGILGGCKALMGAIVGMMGIAVVLTVVLGVVLVRFWPIFLVAFALFAVYKVLSAASSQHGQAETGQRFKQSRNGRRAHIEAAIPAREPIRGALIEVVEEAHALRAMADRAAEYDFAVAGFSATLHPDTFRARSEEAIAIAIDLTDRVHLIVADSHGRSRSARATVAMNAQRARMEQLQQALAYSRDAIEEMILTKGERPDGAIRLAQSLRNLTDAIDESNRDPFDVEFERTVATVIPRPAR